MREQEMFEMDDLQKLEVLHQNMKLELELQNCQNALLKSNQKVIIKEMENIKIKRKLKTEARILERENTENGFITKKLYEVTKEIDELKNKLELEHNRTVRAEAEIEEIRIKEKFFRYRLEDKTRECRTKTLENEKVTMECEYKTEEIERLKAELEQCFDLHSEYDELVKSQREVCETQQNKLEELRTSMINVKQKNAESEEKLKKSKADLAEREKLLMSISERGLSDLKSERRIKNSNKVYTKFVQSPTIDSNINTLRKQVFDQCI